MGLPVFKGYYTIHDMDKPSISFIPIKGSSKPYVILYQEPTQILDVESTNYVNIFIPLILTLICATVVVILFYPWVAARWSYTTMTFWLIFCIFLFVLLTLNLGVFTPLLNYILGSSNDQNFMVDFGPALLTIVTMVIIYVMFIKPKVFDPYGYGW